MIVHLVDGTYELFRHFYGLRRFSNGDGPAVRRRGRRPAHGRCRCWRAERRTSASRPTTSSNRFATTSGAGYKTGEGIEPALWRQFHPLEDALTAMGVVGVGRWSSSKPTTRSPRRRVWRRRTRASRRSASGRPTRTWRSASSAIASCRSTARAARSETPTAVSAKFGVTPVRFPDYLALVGDAADGYPGIDGYRPEDGGAVHRALGPARGLPSRGPRSSPRSGAALQTSRDPPSRRAAFRRR